VKRTWVVLLLAVLPLLVPAAVADEAADTEAALASAAQAVAEGRVTEATGILQEALDRVEGDASRVRLHAALGDALMRSGETYAALQHLQAAAEQRGTAEDHLALAWALLSIARANAAAGQSRWIEVVPYLEDTIAEAEQAEGDGVVAVRRQALVGEARYLMGEPEAAVAAWSGIDLSPLGAQEAARLEDLDARALYDLGRFDESAAAFERAGNVRGAASALAAARKGPEAVAAYAKLLAADPTDETLLEEAVAAARYASAEAELAGALSDLEVDETARAPILVARAQLAEASGAMDAAERLAVAATEADPAAARPWRELGRIRLLTAGGDDDRLDEAIGALLESLRRAPADDGLVRLLWDVAGRDYTLLWRSSRAAARTLRVQQALVDASPEDELALANLGNTLRLMGRADEAVEAYDRAVALAPYDPAILSDRGLALSGRGDAKAALAAFEAAVEADPDFDAARQNAARQHWLAGRDDEAAAHLGEAERRTRAVGGNWMRYRFLLDRVYRTRVRPEVR